MRTNEEFSFKKSQSVFFHDDFILISVSIAIWLYIKVKLLNIDYCKITEVLTAEEISTSVIAVIVWFLFYSAEISLLHLHSSLETIQYFLFLARWIAVRNLQLHRSFNCKIRRWLKKVSCILSTPIWKEKNPYRENFLI